MGFDQRHIGHQRTLHDIGFAVKLAQLFAFGHDGAHTGLGKKRRDASAAGTQLLRQRALRREFEGQLAGQVLALELFVLTDVAGNHFLDLAGLEQLAQSEAVDAGVVGNRGQVLRAAVTQGINQGLWDAAQTKTADGDELVVVHDAVKRGGRAGEYFVHCRNLR